MSYKGSNQERKRSERKMTKMTKEREVIAIEGGKTERLI
jgi:hypothetical protein